jgi:hypothetical protein
MSETMIALLITVFVVAVLVLWVPLLHRLQRRTPRTQVLRSAVKSQLGKQQFPQNAKGIR